ncbi:serine protease inhibitor Cvsi-2-like [Dreissena polymorpha]|uniref:Uncharacterized protein n=1 Tax=Dreissena polymorpha TaxID=45954 RepID=A0A9D4FPI6_DREPO|nr:serine protease inhibitor Cvsi-2-like [Dreissena polymorpha]KAH3802613.1 hypothetical protein DPMN_156291 [Dreissena polymorpha]
MKVAIVLLAVCIAVAYAEECHDIGDCGHVTCPESGYALVCEHRQCTCARTGDHTCATVADCSGRCERDWHCVDGKCKCGL